MGLLHAAIGAALELRPEVKIEEIEQIDIFMPEAACGHGGGKRLVRWNRSEQMNVAYAVAVVLLDGGVLVDQFSTTLSGRKLCRP